MNPESEGMDRNYLKSLRREGLNIGILKGENYFTRKTVIRLLDSVFPQIYSHRILSSFVTSPHPQLIDFLLQVWERPEVEPRFLS